MWFEKPKDIHFVKMGNQYVQLERVYKGEKFNTDYLTTTFILFAVVGLVVGYVL